MHPHIHLWIRRPFLSLVLKNTLMNLDRSGPNVSIKTQNISFLLRPVFIETLQDGRMFSANFRHKKKFSSLTFVTAQSDGAVENIFAEV